MTPVGLAAQSSPEGVPLDGVSLGRAGLCPDNEIPVNLRSQSSSWYEFPVSLCLPEGCMVTPSVLAQAWAAISIAHCDGFGLIRKRTFLLSIAALH